jgi:hypothetical protein
MKEKADLILHGCLSCKIDFKADHLILVVTGPSVGPFDFSQSYPEVRGLALSQKASRCLIGWEMVE